MEKFERNLIGFIKRGIFIKEKYLGQEDAVLEIYRNLMSEAKKKGFI